jgi:hypothetical protein
LQGEDGGTKSMFCLSLINPIIPNPTLNRLQSQDV